MAMTMPGSSSSKNCGTTVEVIAADQIVSGMSKIELQEDNDFEWQVFTNDLIWSNIVENLNHADMKKMNVTCKYFWDKIKENETFQKQSKFRLDSLICADQHFGNCWAQLKWKHVNIRIDRPSTSIMDQKKTSIFRNRLQNVETMELGTDISSDDTDIIDLKIASFLKTIFSIPLNLKSLTLDCFILGIIGLHKSFSSKEVKTCFGRMSELHIVNPNVVGTIDLDLPDTLKMNLKALASIPMKLKAFTWGVIDVSPKECIEDMADIVSIVEKNRLTLTSISLKLFVWRFEALKEIICPELKSLVVFARFKNFMVVHEFLKKQPLLESVDLEFMDYCPEEIIKTIQERSQKLQKLRIKTPSFSDDYKVRFYLSGMAHLLDVEIDLSMDTLDTETEISVPLMLAALPVCLKSLRLRRLYSGWDENCECICDTCGRLCTCGNICGCPTMPRPMAELMIPRLQRFENLTELTILNRNHNFGSDDEDDYDLIADEEGVINDEVLQFIVSNMTNLKILGFADCNTLTDFGLTGRKPNGQQTGTSIQNLHGLRELTIKDCPKLTDAGLSCAVKFPALNYLYLAVRVPNPKHSNMVKTKKLIQIVKQNPVLKTIVVHSSDKNVAKTLMAANAHIVHVHNTHTKSCCLMPFLRIFDVQIQPSANLYQDPNSDCEYDGDIKYETDWEDDEDSSEDGW